MSDLWQNKTAREGRLCVFPLVAGAHNPLTDEARALAATAQDTLEECISSKNLVPKLTP